MRHNASSAAAESGEDLSFAASTTDHRVAAKSDGACVDSNDDTAP